MISLWFVWKKSEIIYSSCVSAFNESITNENVWYVSVMEAAADFRTTEIERTIYSKKEEKRQTHENL